MIAIDRKFLPKLSIEFDERGNVTNNYNWIDWKFCRLIVKNKGMKGGLVKLIKPDQTAMNCNATIKILQNEQQLFNFKGRWSNTMELPAVTNSYEKFRLAQFPESINIKSGKEELLDLLACNLTSNSAFKWNNENYLYGWDFPNFQLQPGKYILEIEITSDNCFPLGKRLRLSIGSNVSDVTIETL